MFAAALLIASATAGGGDFAVRIEALDDPTRVKVSAPLPTRAWEKLPQGSFKQSELKHTLRFCLVDENGEPGPAMFGKYQRQGDALVFVPRYRLGHENLYRAILKLPSGRQVTRDYRVPARKPSSRAVVERIYPTSEVLPANLLKFYIHFSKPMREGREIFQHLRLLDSAGKEIADPWRRTELWTPDARRFTLWIHPGRVKQGVNLREDEGPVLVPNQQYTLVVSGELRDAEGQLVGTDFKKSFRTVEEDHARPLPQNWKVRRPQAGSRDPLVLEFGEGLDQPMLFRLVEVHDRRGTMVPGRVALEKKETRWTFRPQEVWTDDDYQIVVNELLEDLAGNTPIRAFDTDLKEPPGVKARLAIPFRAK